MGLTLFVVFQALLLFANSLAVLHEQRFLNKGKFILEFQRKSSRSPNICVLRCTLLSNEMILKVRLNRNVVSCCV